MITMLIEMMQKMEIMMIPLMVHLQISLLILSKFMWID